MEYLQEEEAMEAEEEVIMELEEIKLEVAEAMEREEMEVEAVLYMVEAELIDKLVQMVFALFSIGYNINYLNNKAIGFFLSPSVFLL